MGIVAASGVAEKDIALRIALAIQAGLADDDGIHVVMTRTEDKELSLLERASLATQAKGRLFLSIHTGGSTATAARGFEVFAPAAGSSTSGGVTASMSTESVALGKIAEQALATGTGASSRGVRTASLRLLGGVAMPGLLIEVGILSTMAEEAELGSEAFAGKVAAALVDVAKQASARAKGGQ
jgi:N-acetylmuramoyl-L-alanine amidase